MSQQLQYLMSVADDPEAVQRRLRMLNERWLLQSGALVAGGKDSQGRRYREWAVRGADERITHFVREFLDEATRRPTGETASVPW